jgi:hypothetical protein
MSNLGDFFSLVAEEEKKKKEELEAKLEKAKANLTILQKTSDSNDREVF